MKAPPCFSWYNITVYFFWSHIHTFAAHSFIPLFLVFVWTIKFNECLRGACKLGKDVLFPVVLDKVHVVSGHPPLQQEKKKTVDDENSGVDEPCKGAQGQRPVRAVRGGVTRTKTRRRTVGRASRTRWGRCVRRPCRPLRYARRRATSRKTV